jgi:hypothetical protein
MATFQAWGSKWIPQVCYAVTAGSGARRSVPHQAPACRVHGTTSSPPPRFSSSDGIWHRQIEPVPTWRTTAPWQFVRQETAMPVAADPTWHGARREQQRIVGTDISIDIYRKAVADVGKNLSALARRSGQLRPYVRPVTRHLPLAIIGVRVCVRHQSVWRAQGTDVVTVSPELSN